MSKTVEKYQKYAEYQDSCVEWLGQVPEQWVVTKLKYVKSEEQNAFVDGPFGSNLKSEHFIDNGDVYVIESNFATTGRINIDDLKTISFRHFETINRSEAKSGDIILAKIGARYGSSAILPTLPKKAVVSGNSLKLTINDKICDVKFALYLLGHLKREGAMDDGVNGSAQPALSLGGLNCLPFLLPSFIEQTSIVNFLDHETAQIDSLIAKQEKLIELLKEKRQAVISHAVTKGLNPDVNMKDSGVEWLGQVPEHWNVLPIKYLTKYVGTGGTPKNQSSFAEVPEINWFTPGDFSGDLKIVDSSKYVTFSSVEDGDSKLYEGKSVLMIGIGATLGKVAISDRDFSCNQQINVLTCNKLINPEFLTFSLMSQLEQIKQLSNSSTIGIINQEKTKQISITVPSVEEQNKIIHFIMDNIEKFNTLINKAESAIQLMQERRTALISSAVTGKIDVRNWQHPNEAKTGLSL